MPVLQVKKDFYLLCLKREYHCLKYIKGYLKSERQRKRNKNADQTTQKWNIFVYRLNSIYDKLDENVCGMVDAVLLVA